MKNIDFNATKAFFEGKVNNFNTANGEILQIENYMETQKNISFYIVYQGKNHFWYVQAGKGLNADYVYISFHSDYDDRMMSPIIQERYTVKENETLERFLSFTDGLWDAAIGGILTEDNY